jgi:hypothetical protein
MEEIDRFLAVYRMLSSAFRRPWLAAELPSCNAFKLYAGIVFQ